MTHEITLTLGARFLAHSVLSIPEQFKTPSEIVRAAHLQDLLAVEVTDKTTKEEYNAESTVVLTEAQRDMLKKAVEAQASKIPVSLHAARLLKELGFDE